MPQAKSQHESKTKILDAALYVFRAKGYSATKVEDICAEAGLTKGGFFHHFKSKEQLAIAAADHFAAMADGLFSTAPYRRLEDPLERLLGYVDFRKDILTGELPEYTCLLGTMVQETYETHPDIRITCDRWLSAHIDQLTQDVAAAKALYAPDAQWSPESVGYFMQALLQGSFIFAKAKQSPRVAAECLNHLRRYLTLLFKTQGEKESPHDYSIAARKTRLWR